MTKKVIIYTDGGCDPNPGPGGWGVLILSGKVRTELSGSDPESTNNRMELTAAIRALNSLEDPCDVTLFTDSQYVQKGIEEWMPKWLAKKWKGANGPVANQDLWKELLQASQKHQVTWKWLRGHSGNVYNHRVDQLAGNEIRKIKSKLTN